MSEEAKRIAQTPAGQVRTCDLFAFVSGNMGNHSCDFPTLYVHGGGIMVLARDHCVAFEHAEFDLAVACLQRIASARYRLRRDDLPPPPPPQSLPPRAAERKIDDPEVVAAFDRIDPIPSMSGMRDAVGNLRYHVGKAVILHGLARSRFQFTWSCIAKHFEIDEAEWPPMPDDSRERL